MRVELDAFSGRPNPTWDLAPDEAAEFSRLISGLPPSLRSVDEGNLGYRGFVVRALGDSPREIRVHNGVVRIAEGGHVREGEDTHRVESWLEEQARRRGYGDVLIWSKGGKQP
jgi:hypothetical protein